MFNIVRDWRGGKKAASTFFLLSLTSSLSFADNGPNNQGRLDYDLDNDGLIEINDHFDLNEIRNNVDGYSLYGANTGCPTTGCFGFELTTDIDLDTNGDGVIDLNDEYWNSDFQGNGLGWLPIGSTSYLQRFRAVFEGNGHVIKNLYINRPLGNYIGLFGFVEGATIRNVGLTGPLASINGGERVGALTAIASGSYIQASYNTIPVKGVSQVGGLIGEASDSEVISNFNTGSVTANENAGGLIALAQETIVTANFNTGSVNDGFIDMGGLIGGAFFSHIRSNYSTGKVSPASITSGLIGIFYGGEVRNSYWAIDSSNQSSSYGQNHDLNVVGLNLKTLSCATRANITPYDDTDHCLSNDDYVGGTTLFTYLYSGWQAEYLNGQATWDFGNQQQLPGLNINGTVYRDSDGDGILDNEDQYIYDTDNDGIENQNDGYPFISIGNFLDSDSDGIPDECDYTCNGMLSDEDDDNDGVLDINDDFPLNFAASIDGDLDQLPDQWNSSCDINCQNASSLILDLSLRDTDNDGILNLEDSDENGDGILDADADSDGLIDISTLAQLNAIRHQPDGNGLRMEENGLLEQTGCPISRLNGQIIRQCHGYELVNDLDFDTNQDGIMNENDDYWNGGLGWEPISSTNNPFSTDFQGNGHLIRNLYINRPQDPFVGFFARTDSAYIQNVGFTGQLMSITGGAMVGSIVGYATGHTVLLATFNTGKVSIESGYTGIGVGGLVGQSSGNNFINLSFNTGSVNGGNYTDVGGLIGTQNINNEIFGSFNAGKVTGNSYHKGGLAGVAFGRSATGGYWAIDSSTQSNSAGEINDKHFGVSLKTLQCVDSFSTLKSHETCFSQDEFTSSDHDGILFSYWNSVGTSIARWDLGNEHQLPGIRLSNGTIYRDSDADGILDSEDPSPYDADNDDINDQNDGYPLIHIGNLLDTDGDGIPDECDTTCTSLGMSQDTDDDNDGVLDINDPFPIDAGEWADTDGNGIGDNADVIVKRPSTIPTHIAYHGWTTMMNTLSGQNTQGTTFPSAEHDPSLYALVGEMYLANGLNDYVYDFHYLREGSQHIDNHFALEHLNNTSASVVVLSANSTGLGITSDPSKLTSDTSWINKTVNMAEIAKRRNITPVLFQAWGNSTESAYFHNAKRNSDTLQAKTALLVIRSAEIVDALGKINSDYVLNSQSSSGKHSVPVTHLYSGDVTDDHSASYALAYANALATFKVLTGISARNNAFVIPSSDITGENYGMSDQFIEDIITTVDDIQKETLITKSVEGDLPTANDFVRDVTENESISINIPLAANLYDDERIKPESLTVSHINESDFNYFSLNNNIFTFSSINSSEVTFHYVDSDDNSIEFTLEIRTQTLETKIPQEIIIGFGEGDWSIFDTSDNLYNHSRTQSNKVINGIRAFNSLATQGNLKNAKGRNIGSVTSLTEGLLSGPGYDANAIPGVSDYGPFAKLYDGLSIAPSGSRVSFSINGLEEGAQYRVYLAGRYHEETENIVHVNMNGVIGSYDSSGSPDNNSEFEKAVTVNSDGKLIVTLKSNGESSSEYWGISYLYLSEIMSEEETDVPTVDFYIHPENQSTTLGSNVTFKAEATGADTYQWYRNGTIIQGATASEYTITTREIDDNTEFYVLAMKDNQYGTFSESGRLTITTNIPTIVEQPLPNISVTTGDHLVLDVVAIDALSYQWQRDGVDLYGETKARLSLPVTDYDDGSIFTVLVSNSFGSILSESTVLNITDENLEYWFSFGRSDGHAAPFEDFSYDSVPSYNAYGYNGESINFIRSFPYGTVSKVDQFRDTDGNRTDLSMTFSNIGSNFNPINGWNEFNPDVILNSNVEFNLVTNDWFNHANLYAYHIYMGNNQVMQLSFSEGGLNPGETWTVQALGLHYQDYDRPVDVTINGEGSLGNMSVGNWDNISVFEQTTTVDENGEITINIAPQVNANINAIKLIKSN